MTIEESGEAETSTSPSARSGSSRPASSRQDSYFPRARSGLESFRVQDEVVLLPDSGNELYALNRTGARIWELCDGRHSLSDIFDDLRYSFDGETMEIATDLNTALIQLRELELLQATARPASRAQQDSRERESSKPSDARPPVRIAHGVEDRPYFHWQLAVMFESLIGQLPAGWDILIVVCNNHQPLSDELVRILDTYNVCHFTGTSPADNFTIDVAAGSDRYTPMNRLEALNVLRHHARPDDIICLMDTDLFLYGDLRDELFPQKDALTANWIVAQEKFFHFSTDDQKGVSLPKLLDALGFEQEFKAGGVMIFLRGETLLKEDGKYVRDCFRFLQILYLAGKILELPDHGVWVAEMACFSLAASANDIDFDILDHPEFAVQNPEVDELPEGSFHHYYTDKNDSGPGPFLDSAWHKQLFADQSFLRADIESFLSVARGPVEQRFMELAIHARDRIYGVSDDSIN
ncbi:MAG: PqqD family protein [Pseudomonadota bacterium]